MSDLEQLLIDMAEVKREALERRQQMQELSERLATLEFRERIPATKKWPLESPESPGRTT